MPLNMSCTSCNLRITVGWFHDGTAAEGYGARTLLVCKACGTEHAVRVALRDRGPEWDVSSDIELLEVSGESRVKVMSLLRQTFDMSLDDARSTINAAPIKIARRAPRHLVDRIVDEFTAAGADLTLTEADRTSNPNWGPLQKDVLLARPGPRFENESDWTKPDVLAETTGPHEEIKLEDQPCSHCKVRGTLSSDQDEIGTCCPNCGETTLEVTDGWVS